MSLEGVQITDRQLKDLGQLVYRHCGIDLHEGKRELVQARLAKRIRSLGCSGVTEYLDELMSNPDGPEFTQLIDAISTNLTSFFRESSHFDFLKQRLLPDLVKQRTVEGRRRVRVWSAGCSSGEEPYSLAMTLLDAIPNSASWDIKILATDISHSVLNMARRGVYAEQKAAGIPIGLRQKHVAKTKDAGPGMVAIEPKVRELIKFNYLNLMEPWPFEGPFDFIFCRNVMIYFDKPTQQKLVARFHGVLSPGGMLFTGHSESLTGITHPLKYVEPTVYARTEGRAAA